MILAFYKAQADYRLAELRRSWRPWRRRRKLLSALVREYRVLCHDGRRPFPDVKLTVREDDTVYAGYDSDRLMEPEDDDRFQRRMAGLRGVRGLVEATARECELAGHVAEVTVREVGPWEQVNREELVNRGV